MRSSTGMQSLCIVLASVAEVTEILFAGSDLVTVASLDESINTDATQSASGPAGGERHEPVLSQDLRRITDLRRALGFCLLLAIWFLLPLWMNPSTLMLHNRHQVPLEGRDTSLC